LSCFQINIFYLLFVRKWINKPIAGKVNWFKLMIGSLLLTALIIWILKRNGPIEIEKGTFSKGNGNL
jgi:hypothetical protein